MSDVQWDDFKASLREHKPFLALLSCGHREPFAGKPKIGWSEWCSTCKDFATTEKEINLDQERRDKTEELRKMMDLPPFVSRLCQHGYHGVKCWKGTVPGDCTCDCHKAPSEFE